MSSQDGSDGSGPHADAPSTQGAIQRRWTPYKEAKLTWLFVYRDLSAALIPACLFLLSAAKQYHTPPVQILGASAKVLLWLALYIYVFCLSNQLTDAKKIGSTSPNNP